MINIFVKKSLFYLDTIYTCFCLFSMPTSRSFSSAADAEDDTEDILLVAADISLTVGENNQQENVYLARKPQKNFHYC